MKQRLLRRARLGTFTLSVLVFAPVVSSARAETKIMKEAEGKQASLALLEAEMKSAAGRFCGAKRSKLVVRVDDQGAVTTTTERKWHIKEEILLETARALGANQSVTVLYCLGSGDDLVATGTTVSHVVWNDKSGWTASVVRSGKSLTAKRSDFDKLTDAEVAQVLAEASREINKAVPMVVDKGLRLDGTVGANKVLLYNYTLVDHEASAVNTNEFRDGMRARLVPGVCKDEAMQFLLQNGVRYRYRYRGKDGKEVATITVGSADCK